MEYVIIGACIVVAIAGGIVLYVKNKRTKNELGNTAVVVSKTSSSKLQASEVANDPVIQIGILPADAISDETKLVEITDSKVLAHINNLVPGLAQAGNAANNATQAVKANGEVLYRAIIPAGAKLTDSKAMEGAVRGFYHGADGIRGHANLVAVEAQKGTAVAAMGVASMIVGQYYMTQINAELGVISDGISQIQNFQDNEYRSRVFSLVAHVKKIADFQTEILENDELRLSKIAQLDSLEEECTKLLGQANLTLAGFAKKSGLNYDGYEKALGNAQNWFMYQQSLLEILYKISDLRYTLHLGTVSREQCTEALTDVESPEINALKNYLTLSFKKDKMAFIEENPFVAWSAMVSNKDGTYGKPAVNSRILQLQMEFEFPEESLEAKMKRVMLLMEEESELKKVIKAQKIELEAATIETIKNLDEEDALRLLELKWIEPIVSGLGTLPDDVITALVSEVENLNSKYATTYSDIEVKKESAAGSLIQMIDGLSGSKDDLDGLAEFKKYMGVKNEKE